MNQTHHCNWPYCSLFHEKIKTSANALQLSFLKKSKEKDNNKGFVFKNKNTYIKMANEENPSLQFPLPSLFHKKNNHCSYHWKRKLYDYYNITTLLSKPYT